jgi:hypothetical protein
MEKLSNSVAGGMSSTLEPEKPLLDVDHGSKKNYQSVNKTSGPATVAPGKIPAGIPPLGLNQPASAPGHSSYRNINSSNREVAAKKEPLSARKEPTAPLKTSASVQSSAAKASRMMGGTTKK